jgi:hypothetical protein
MAQGIQMKAGDHRQSSGHRSSNAHLATNSGRQVANCQCVPLRADLEAVLTIRMLLMIVHQNDQVSSVSATAR